MEVESFCFYFAKDRSNRAEKSCSENMQQIYRRTRMPSCGLKNSPVNLLHIFRTPLHKTISGRLLLQRVQY